MKTTIKITVFIIAAVGLGMLIGHLTRSAKTSISKDKNLDSSVNEVVNVKAVSLDDYWNGAAKWNLFRSYTLKEYNAKWKAGYTTYSFIEKYKDMWLLFSRKVEVNHPECPGNTKLSLEVRSSTDKGVTFSDPIDVVSSDSNTPWECAVTDGSAYFNQNENTWYLLTQCLSRDGVWNGCLFTREKDPLGKFTPSPKNPVVLSGLIWSKLCPEGSECRQIVDNKPVLEEGTFDIVDFVDGNYYVSFHGFANPYGVRGLAITKDFISWDTSKGAKTLISNKQTNGWREEWKDQKSIGVGAGSIIKNGDYFYSLIESSDISLGCTVGQKWDVGILRTSDLFNGSWEQYPQGNPIYYSSINYQDESKTKECNVQYPQFFIDGEDIYFSVIRNEVEWNIRGLYIYKLEKTANKLSNADFWKCDTTGWISYTDSQQQTTMDVLRTPSKSSDKNCYLSASCGGKVCGENQSIYQVINVSNANTIKFGAKLASELEGVWNAKIVLWEISPVMKPHEITIADLTSVFKEYSTTTAISPNTTKLRLQIYLKDGNSSIGSYKIDEAFVEVVN